MRAVGDAWNSPLHLQENRRDIQECFGSTAFNTALAFSSGMAGASLMRSVPVALEERAILRDMKNYHAESAEHSVRTARYSELTAKEMGLPFGLRRRVYHAGLMHDAGKLDMPLEVLGKTDGKPFTPEQLEVVHQHPLDTLERLQHVPYKGELIPVPEDASMHHEWFNGEGYPFHLKGEQIPVPARAIPPADVFDAVTAGRAYMQGQRMPLAEVKSLMDGGRGTHFDPQALDALWSIRMDKALSVMESGAHRAPLASSELRQFRGTTLGRMLDVAKGLDATIQEKLLSARLTEIYSKPAI
jgi:HD-GYP domain-containing protein (c-di-GMP phosphodiesterase class II)